MNISLPESGSEGFFVRVTLLLIAMLGGFTVSAGNTGSMVPVLVSQQGAAPLVNPQHPERYIVQRGDTLWDISAVFLRDPWYWPEIWYVNPQVENPHLIYPGDVLTLVYVDGKPQLRLERGGVVTQGSGTERLSPRIREESLEQAIPVIPLEVIRAFLNRGQILEQGQAEQLPYIMSVRDGFLMAGAGDDVYVRGDVSNDDGYSVIRKGDPLIDPDNGDIVAYEGIFVGVGTIRRGGDPATLRLTTTTQEATAGNVLLTETIDVPLQFFPRAPETGIDASIIAVVDGVSQIGQYQVVILNRGDRDGLEQGHVLTAWQSGKEVSDRFASGFFKKKVRLPDEPAGTLMVFRTYDRISYALIMEATSEIHVFDKARTPL